MHNDIHGTPLSDDDLQPLNRSNTRLFIIGITIAGLAFFAAFFVVLAGLLEWTF